MTSRARIFKIQTVYRQVSWLDAIILVALAAFIYGGIHLGFYSPETVTGPEITLSPWKLPEYAAHSLGRMFVAYLLSLLFSLSYGTLAANNRQAERILLPVLDILQSVPILSFLPVVLLGLSAILPQYLAAEIASIVLIFTSQAWNLTFAWYQSLVTTPKELTEASTIFSFNAWMRFKTLQLPFAAISLIWNSMMSWAGGWFFLMAAEIFTVGRRDFRLPGLGSFLQEASAKGDIEAILWGMLAIILVIVVLDQFVWRPLLAWAERFKIAMLESEAPPTSWVYDAMLESRLITWFRQRVLHPAEEVMDTAILRRFKPTIPQHATKAGGGMFLRIITVIFLLCLGYGAYKAGHMLLSVSFLQWQGIGLGVGATFLRVVAALAIAMVWTIPVGVLIGTNPRLASFLQPLVQITASIPATAIFPVVLIFLLNIAGGLNIAAILIMLMGTQWYLLFNIIAGAATIPQDLKDTTTMMALSPLSRWKNLILPALFPYIITGSITAGGGAWNASIISEYVNFGGKTFFTTGIGATIARATASGDYALLLAGTLSMVITVVLINRFFWRRLYHLAEEKYHLE